MSSKMRQKVERALRAQLPVGVPESRVLALINEIDMLWTRFYRDGAPAGALEPLASLIAGVIEAERKRALSRQALGHS